MVAHEVLMSYPQILSFRTQWSIDHSINWLQVKAPKRHCSSVELSIFNLFYDDKVLPSGFSYSRILSYTLKVAKPILPFTNEQKRNKTTCV